MIALCWKELRENYRWALLVMCGLGLAEWYALCQTEDAYQVGIYYNSKGLSLCKTVFLTVTSFGCPVAGLLLGCLQILPELRRDQWAALVHRPVSRGVIFRGKVAGGLLLYALATVPPLLLSIWLAATPGRFAMPFVPELALPATADVCTGAVYYFAALAMTLPRGGWLGWRLLPLLAALHASSFVTSTALFSVAVGAAVLMSLTIFAAGWGIMLHQEKLAARPWVARLALLATLYYGACGLGDLGHMLCEAFQPQPHSHIVEYAFTDDGTPIRITHDDQIITSVVGLNGQPLADKKYQPDQIAYHEKYLHSFSSYIGDAHGWQPRDYRPTYRDVSRYLSFESPYIYPRPEQWFYLVRRHYWVGYRLVKNVPAATLDRNGYESLAVAPLPFRNNASFRGINNDLIMYDRQNVRLANLPKRKILNLSLPAPGPVYGVGTAFASSPGHTVSVFGVALASGLVVYADKGTLLARLPYHQDVARWGRLSLGLNSTGDRYYLHYDPSAWIDGEIRATMPAYVEELDARGNVVKTATLPPLPPPVWAPAWSAFLSGHLQSPAFFFGVLAYTKIGAMRGSQRLANLLATRLGHDRRGVVERALTTLVISSVLALTTLVWARRAFFSWRAAWSWAGFVFLFNVGGFIAFCAGADWPALVPCPACRRGRPAEGEHCPRCGAGWPGSAPNGTEIFDHTQQALAAVGTTT